MAKILYAIHLYPPRHMCGGETYIHTISRYMISKGHSVKVLHYDAHKYNITSMYDFEGVSVFTDANEKDLFDWADVVVTHLDYSKKVISRCREWGKKKCVWIAHSHHPYPSVEMAENPVKVVYNAQWVKDSLNYKNDSFIFYPPVDDWYLVEPDKPEYITLINLSESKGSAYFYSIAKKLPQYKFLAVKGSYENQILSDLPNVTTLPIQPDIRSVYARSKIVMMPSKYESWGKVATEAMINGIPVIASPTEGLKENLSYAGLFYNRKETVAMAAEIEKLMTDEKYYKKQSDLCKKRAAELKPDFEALERFLLS